MILVKFYNADVNFKAERKSDLKQFISFIFLNENKEYHAIDIISCSDTYLLQLNRQFLNHDYYTDILTFDVSQDNKQAGEIYISIDRVKENSRLQKVSFQTEMNRIIFHGILHLCGYSDKSKSEKKIMTSKENDYLKKFESFHVKQKQK